MSETPWIDRDDGGLDKNLRRRRPTKILVSGRGRLSLSWPAFRTFPATRVSVSSENERQAKHLQLHQDERPADRVHGRRTARFGPRIDRFATCDAVVPSWRRLQNNCPGPVLVRPVGERHNCGMWRHGRSGPVRAADRPAFLLAPIQKVTPPPIAWIFPGSLARAAVRRRCRTSHRGK